SDYLQVYEKWDKKRDEFVKHIEDLVKALSIKETKETEVLNFDFDYSILDHLSDIEKEIELLVQNNNTKTTSLRKDKASIQREILLSDIKEFLAESDYYANIRNVELLEVEKNL